MNLRPGLPPLPERMRSLPLDHRGYPVPFFVAWINGQPDFRVMDPEKWRICVQFRRCWLCGGQLGRTAAFVVGPMCAVNRTSAEPPSHRECAVFAAMACPFLTMPKMDRRENDLPEGWKPPAGEMIRRNPGVCLVWMSKSYRPWHASNGHLFDIGDPEETRWFAQGRPATHEEVKASIDSGLPILEKMALEDGAESVQELNRRVADAMLLLPPPTEARPE